MRCVSHVEQPLHLRRSIAATDLQVAESGRSRLRARLPHAKHSAQPGSLGRQRGHPPPAIADPAHRSVLPHRAGPRRDRLRQAACRARHPRPLHWCKRPIHRRQRQCARRIHRQRRSRARLILAICRFPARIRQRWHPLPGQRRRAPLHLAGRPLPFHPRLRGASQRRAAGQPQRLPPQRAGTH